MSKNGFKDIKTNKNTMSENALKEITVNKNIMSTNNQKWNKSQYIY